MAVRSEASIRRSVVKYLNTLAPEVIFYPLAGSQYGRRGAPDIVGCCCGEFFAMEIKSETGKLSKLQEYEQQRIKKAHGHWFLIRSLKAAKAAVAIMICGGGGP